MPKIAIFGNAVVDYSASNVKNSTDNERKVFHRTMTLQAEEKTAHFNGVVMCLLVVSL